MLKMQRTAFILSAWLVVSEAWSNQACTVCSRIRNHASTNTMKTWATLPSSDIGTTDLSTTPPLHSPPHTPRAGNSPVLVLEDDTLNTTPIHVALVVALWALSIAALSPVACVAVNVASCVQLVATAAVSLIFSDLFSG